MAKSTISKADTRLKKVCAVPWCDRKHQALGYCATHYYQIKNNNAIFLRTQKTPNEFIENDDICHIVLYNMACMPVGRAIIDKEDVPRCKKKKWYLSGYGYVVSRDFETKKLIYLHQYILGCKGIDHKNGDSLDNRKSNLRPCSQSQNLQNKRASHKTSKYKGVWLDKNRKKWCSQITHNRKRFWIGEFELETDAAKAYNLKAADLFGEFARLNVITLPLRAAAVRSGRTR